MRVLVTGGAGYIGSVLTSALLEEGFDVTVLDRFFFGTEPLDDVKDRIRVVHDDVRWFDPKILEGVDAVMDLAALSNDPAGELNPEKTMDINYRGRMRVATLAKKYMVPKYILASSCSVYGLKKEIVDEESSTDPLTTYAKACALWEKEALGLADRNFCVTSFRQATVYGLSKRMRFDTAVNAMTLGYFKEKKARVLRDGTQGAVFIHVKDTSNAFITALKADRDIVNGQVFNSGSNEQNFRIIDLAKAVAEGIGVPFEYEWYGSLDHRNYRVNFDKISKVLKFKAKYTLRDGASEVYRALESGELKDEEKTITVRWYKKLIEMHDILKQIEIRGEVL